MLKEHRPLQAGRPVQRYIAVLLFQRGNPALKLLLARSADRKTYEGIEHRRVPTRL